MGETLQMKAADGHTFPAYVARPAGKARGAVVVLQEIFGVNSHIRAVADGYAAEGYLAVAPSTFHRVKADVELGYSPDDMSAGIALKAAVEALPAPGVLADIQAAIDHASQAGKVGIVGYCWGGLLTWRAACLLQGLSAAAPYYGGGTTTPDEIARKPKVPRLSNLWSRKAPASSAKRKLLQKKNCLKPAPKLPTLQPISLPKHPANGTNSRPFSKSVLLKP